MPRLLRCNSKPHKTHRQGRQRLLTESSSQARLLCGEFTHIVSFTPRHPQRKVLAMTQINHSQMISTHPRKAKKLWKLRCCLFLHSVFNPWSLSTVYPGGFGETCKYAPLNSNDHTGIRVPSNRRVEGELLTQWQDNRLQRPQEATWWGLGSSMVSSSGLRQWHQTSIQERHLNFC